MVDLERLTPLQQRVAHRFIDALQRGERVCFEDFPEMEQQEFEELADAIVAAVARRH
jgi:hypothetical protein